MEDISAVYVMRVASMLTGMHPQTLRKYERAGFLAPSRSNTMRMYSEEDISRLRTIKHLVDEAGLNLAGVELALSLRTGLLRMKRELTPDGISSRLGERVAGHLDEMLGMLGTG